MIKRYTTEEMGIIWSDKTKFNNWVKVETAALRAKVMLKMLKFKVPKKLEESITIDVEEINRIEKEITKHDVIAFLMHTSPQLPAYLRPFWHHDMTSYDTQDTALSLQLIASVDQLMSRLAKLMTVIKEKAMAYKFTPMIGRTHGVHAEPITFGVKLANWYSELDRNMARLKEQRKKVAVGKISGAVGMYTLSPEVEEVACELLGLKPVIATQIISRDIIAEYCTTLAIIAGALEKIAVTGRTLQRTEILEAQEFFDIHQRGSSAMPHKKNPISFENVSGLVRIIKNNASTALEQISTWDERSIDNSGSERVFLPDSSILLDYLIKRLTGIISKWIIYPEKMMRNLNLTKGLIFSQDVQSLVASKSNLPREEAYQLVRQVALRCWDTEADFLKELLKDKKIMEFVSEKELRACFDLNEKLKHVDYVFRKIFGKKRNNQQ